MIVRESPSPRKPQQTTEWPPKSPTAALASSPSGRKKLEKYYQHRRSPSPSSRRARSSKLEDSSLGNEDEEDEETLKLHIKALEARLKLKKLQKQKQDDKSTSEDPKHGVEVPSSPKRNAPPPTQAQSPLRTRLGLDKAADDVSLKRLPPVTDRRPREVQRHHNSKRQTSSKSKSYAERLIATRGEDKQRNDRHEKTRAHQSQSFGLRDGSPPAPKHNNEVARPATGRPTYDHTQGTHSEVKPSKSTEVDSDSITNFALSKRHINTDTLQSALSDKELYGIPRLLKEVHAPHYDPPDVPGDFVVHGIIASKSTPYSHAPTHKTATSADESEATQRSKFMVLRLTDLEWEVDLFLFGAGFETFWKLTVGTVIAVLNPGIMPPKPHMRDTGKFSLKLGSSEDTVLEVGTSADLGFCKSVKANGEKCGQWIDARKTEYCEFHVGLQVARSKSQRMEINTMGSFGLFAQGSNAKRGGGGGSRGRGGFFGGGAGKGRGQKEKNDQTRGAYYDREAHSAAYSLPASVQRGASTARMLDAEDYGPGAGLSVAERGQKRRAAQEKERDLAKALGREGRGPGVEYLRFKHEETKENHERTTDADGSTSKEAKDASSFGLVREKSAAISLGHQSKKEAVGWSKAFKRGLSPTASTKSPSPKKARFMIDGKGMRTPGAESLPSEKKRRHEINVDDDDDLELV